MRSRQLKAEIQRKPLQNDFVGGAAGWETIGHCYLDLRPVRGKEYYDASQLAATVTHKGETEYRNDVTEDMRLRIGTRVLNIQSVINVNEANRSLELMLSENKHG